MPDIFETTDAAPNTATAYALQVGQVAQGTLGTTGDHDWYSVNLVAGQTYTFALVGTGMNGVDNPFLQLIGPNGVTVVANNDDGLPNYNSVFTFTATQSGTYYMDVGATNNGTGQYGVSVALGTRATVDVEMGAGIIDAYFAPNDFEYSWSAAPGIGATVSVGFRLTGDTHDPNFSQFTTQQMAATQAILQYFSDVCGLSFNIVNPGGYTNDATILLSNYSNNDSQGAHAFYPGSAAFAAQAGDVHFNILNASPTEIGVGSGSFRLLMHELGHSMGLSHPGLYNAGPGQNITYGTHALFNQDSHQYTVMSYFDESNTTTSWGTNPDTLMMYDIYALQQIYGVNSATRAGNSVYGFNSNVGGVYNFVTNAIPALCIWDGGGTDTLDLSGYSATQLISLVAGTFSNVGGFTGNVSIALGATIENAVGGSGADTIVLSSSNVNNLVNGGGGSDTVNVTYNFGSGYSIQAGSTANNLVIIGAAGTDTLQNVEFVRFANGTVVTTASLIGTTPAADATDDFNGDGRSDILWRNTATGGIVAWLMNGSQATASAFLGGDANWSIVGTGDFNGDGRDDILWRNSSSGSIIQWLMNGTQVTASAPIGGDGTWGIAGTGDFNGDGRDDILWRNASTGGIIQWLMNGSQATASAFVGGDGTWSIAGTGDFNGDGRDDILWRNGSTGGIIQWLMNGAQSTASAFLGGDGTWSIAGTGDFNGDGRDDILWRNGSTGGITQWLMNGAQATTSSFLGGDANWSIVGTGDFNGDGRDDILWRNASSGVTLQWLMNGSQVTATAVLGTDGNWLVV